VLVVVIAVAVGVHAGDNQPPQGWKEVVAKKNAYAAWFPPEGKFEESDQSMASKYGNFMMSRAILKRKDGMLFAASQLFVPPKRVQEVPPVNRIKAYRDIFLSEFKGKLVEEKAIPALSPKASVGGKEYLIATRKDMVRLRVWGTASVVYRAVVVGTREQVTSKDAETFFQGFMLVAPKTG
jgi:hypothetical protein